METCLRRTKKNHPPSCDAHGSRRMLHTLLSFSLIFLVVFGIEGSGVGVSPEEVVVRVNGSFTISCFINTAGGELNFFDGEDMLPNENIKKCNDTINCIKFTSSFTKATKKNFTCKKDRRSAVGESMVRVADTINPVENFKCRTNNLTTVVCSFKQPNSSVPIKYKLKFSINNQTKKHKAELKGDGNFGYSSSIKIATDNFAKAYFRFLLIADNKFFVKREKFSMRLMEILTPRKVEDLKVGATTHNTSIITFTLPQELKRVSQEMLFDVRLEDEYERDKWKKIEMPRLHVEEARGFLALDSLEFANSNYKVQLKMRAKIAMATDDTWSPLAKVSFTTKPFSPVKVPETCRNCFNVMDNGDIMIYWTAVEKKLQNAANFFYRVQGNDENGREIIHSDLTETSVVLPKNLTVENVRIEIRAVNEMGISRNYSQLFLPLKNFQANKLLNIHKQLIDYEYRISWKLPKDVDVESFTVVSCRQHNELSNQCDGPIAVNHLKPETSEYVEAANFTKQFGVAVNIRGDFVAQGFEWASCTAAKQSEVGQVHSIWSNAVAEHSMTLQWQLNCVDEPIVVGCNVTYCEVNELNECSSGLLWNISLGSEVRQFEIQGLKAYTRYKISIALLSTTRHGIFKLPIFARTLESAPTAPQNLTALKISQNSIHLSWNRPHAVNGDSMTYQLWFNDHKININNNNTMNETFDYELDGLEAFTNYTVTVVACTSFCSDLNENLKVTTAIGEPGIMFQPRMESLEDNSVLISWDAPKVAGGNLEFFQFRASKRDGEEKIFRINGKARSCVIKSLNCDSEKIDFSIRSVNVKPTTAETMETTVKDCFEFREPIEGEVSGHFYGEWSEPVVFYCQFRLASMMASVFVLLIFLFTFTYLFVRMYQKYQDMKDIHIVWPKGLDPESPVKKDISEAVKDLDLIKNHVLADIEEEEENEKFLEKRESVKSELFLPFICNPKTNEVFYTMSKIPTERVNLTPKGNRTALTASPTDYMKMYAPAGSPPVSPVAGYLDMSGARSPATPKKSPSSDYHDNDVKMFIKDQEMHNNGYIGKRASIICETKKPTVVVNANGYVGLQK